MLYVLYTNDAYNSIYNGVHYVSIIQSTIYKWSPMGIRYNI